MSHSTLPLRPLAARALGAFLVLALGWVCAPTLAWANTGADTTHTAAAPLTPAERQTRFVKARFAALDTLLARAKRTGATDATLGERYADVIREIIAERSAANAVTALAHLKAAARGYLARAALVAPTRVLVTDALIRQYPPAEAGALLHAAVGLDLVASDHRAAREHIEAALALPQEPIAAKVRAGITYSLGYVEFFDDHLAASAAAFERAGDLYAEAGNTRMRIMSLDASSSAYGEDGHLDKSLACAERAVRLVEAQPDVREAQLAGVNLYLNYAEALYRVGRAAEAFRQARFAKSLAAEGADPETVARAHKTEGRLHVFAGDYRHAVGPLRRAYDMFRGLDNVYLATSTLADLADAYEGLGRHREALAAFRRSTHLADSLERSRQAERVNTLVAAHQAETHTREVALLQEQAARLAAENASHRAERAGIILALVFVTALGLYTWSRLRLRNRRHGQLERKVAERTAELREHARQLERSNTDLERFAYIASHDLKTPLRNVTSFLNLIERRLAPEAKVQVADYLKIAIENARQMHYLVTDVLEFSKIDADLATQSTRFDLGLRVRELVATMQPQLRERSAAVVITGQAELLAPEHYIVQLVRNLVENGLKYNESAAPLITVELVADEREVSVRVGDNGIGIAPEYHARIFELFKRLHTTDAYAGTGLGLAVCKKVVERLGGDIAVESAPGEGSAFTVTLPRDCTARVRHMPTSRRHNAYTLAAEAAN